MLASLCELLVVAREASDAAGQEALYAATLKALTAGQPRASKPAGCVGGPFVLAQGSG
jgi:hypothetical protein